MYLVCLSVNYNNRSLTVGVGNDSQNGIYCCRRAVIHNIWRAILMAMQIRRYDAECIAQYSRSRATLDALDAGIGQVFTPYCPGGRHGHQLDALDAAIGQVFTPYCPGGCHGH